MGLEVNRKAVLADRRRYPLRQQIDADHGRHQLEPGTLLSLEREDRDITFTTTLNLPSGWKFGTALPVAGEPAICRVIVQMCTVSCKTLGHSQ